jgi:ABC-type nickel/cobalt efflux system permease component RcnA
LSKKAKQLHAAVENPHNACRGCGNRHASEDAAVVDTGWEIVLSLGVPTVVGVRKNF